MTFKELNLSAPLLRAVQEAGYETPSPIQAAAIPPVLAGRDLMGCAQTGTGKTAAFECGRDGLLLDRSGGRVAFFGHGTLEWFYQVQFLECHCISVLSRRRAPDNSVLIIYGGKNGKRQTNAHYYWHKGTINSAILVHLD